MTPGKKAKKSEIKAVSGSDWTTDELEYFNVDIVCKNFEEFFGHVYTSVKLEDYEQKAAECSVIDIESLSFDALDPRVVDYLKSAYAVSEDKGNEKNIEHLVRSLLHLFEYDTGLFMIKAGSTIHFKMCGKTVQATADLWVQDIPTTIKLVVVECKNIVVKDGVLGQLFAECVAVYEDNKKRLAKIADRETMAQGRIKPPAFKEYIPGIIMYGTQPVFYKVFVTDNIVTNISQGVGCSEKTIVEEYKLPILKTPLNEVLLRTDKDDKEMLFKSIKAFKSIVFS
ncbi:hypothetical protein CONCODRAFT_11378 [Conidiobolus coronatus NRRL 28638]|uniref:Uncharacterized protein n=1 Tax=Conidiobolus coronatus (strain ATCC 28846 / CBS 209.66 / NRRL 28638) TaxID=796925 RepID=A0A137NVC8_CONC2|nr:hypothetical protein CONCODRAFT_11378 [Conidiobolus coronatus NRRL 28638]|eukprot:KXN66727.1 hypothetical protein CONCODRAFT_11378 [Conidiobolus coronatus NRRL 28638]